MNKVTIDQWYSCTKCALLRLYIVSSLAIIMIQKLDNLHNILLFGVDLHQI
jgi:hypothetical protein